jgi:hypothetical protein
MVKTTGKIQRFSRKSGTAYALKIVHNYWDKARQMGTNKLVKTVLYIPAKQNMNDGLFRVYAWNKINNILNNLCLQKVVSSADADTARTNFAKLIPPIQKPQPSAPVKADPLLKYRHILKSYK